MRYLRWSIGTAVLANVVCCAAFAQTPNSIFFRTSIDNDRFSATLGNVTAHVRLGYRHLTGSAGTDPRQSAWHFAAAAEAGSLAASAWLGYTYVISPELGRQAKEGVSLIHAAANKGDPVAQTLLGRIQDLGLASDVIKIDHDAAQKLFTAAAPTFALARTYLGESYLRLKTDAGYAAAIAVLVSAAEANEPNAMVDLAMLYARGLGVRKNSQKAFHWLQQAASSNDPAAIFQLGYFRRHSPSKLSNNPQMAVTLYQAAADSGYVPAKTALGMCYANGLGVPKDIPQAIKWLSAAAPKSTFAAKQLAIIKANGGH